MDRWWLVHLCPPHGLAAWAVGLRSERLAVHHTRGWTPLCPCLCHRPIQPQHLELATASTGPWVRLQCWKVVRARVSSAWHSAHARPQYTYVVLPLWGQRLAQPPNPMSYRGGHVLLSAWGCRFGISQLHPSSTSHYR